MTPTAFDAWHSIVPESVVCKFDIVKISPLLENWWRESAPIAFPFLYHVTVGVGTPVLTHRNCTVEPMLFVELWGCLAMFGTTETQDNDLETQNSIWFICIKGVYRFCGVKVSCRLAIANECALTSLYLRWLKEKWIYGTKHQSKLIQSVYNYNYSVKQLETKFYFFPGTNVPISTKTRHNTILTEKQQLIRYRAVITYTSFDYLDLFWNASQSIGRCTDVCTKVHCDCVCNGVSSIQNQEVAFVTWSPATTRDCRLLLEWDAGGGAPCCITRHVYSFPYRHINLCRWCRVVKCRVF